MIFLVLSSAVPTGRKAYAQQAPTLSQWQLYVHNRAATDGAIDGEGAAINVNQLLGNRQAKPRALLLKGCPLKLDICVNLRQMFGGDPPASITNGQKIVIILHATRDGNRGPGFGKLIRVIHQFIDDFRQILARNVDGSGLQSEG